MADHCGDRGQYCGAASDVGAGIPAARHVRRHPAGDAEYRGAPSIQYRRPITGTARRADRAVDGATSTLPPLKPHCGSAGPPGRAVAPGVVALPEPADGQELLRVRERVPHRTCQASSFGSGRYRVHHRHHVRIRLQLEVRLQHSLP